MTLEKILCQKLASWRPPGGRRELTVSEEGCPWTVTVTADRCDEVGCLLWEMHWSARPPRLPVVSTSRPGPRRSLPA